jgi:YD repeat-containing protein
VSTTDPFKWQTTFADNSQGDLATITDPLGNSAERACDDASRLLSQTEGVSASG